MGVKIKYEKWVEIHEAFVLYRVYRSYFNDTNEMNKIRGEYRKNVKRLFPEKSIINDLDCIPNSVSLCYLLFVRTCELIKKSFGKEEENKLYTELLKNYKIINIQNYEDIIVYYGFTIEQFDLHSEEDSKNFVNLIKKIRNSLSHMNYSFKGNILEFEDFFPNSENRNFKANIAHLKFLEFVGDYVMILNNLILKNNYLSATSKKD